MTVTEVGGDEPEGVVDRLGVGVNENAAWVNAPGELFVKNQDMEQVLIAICLRCRGMAHTSGSDPGRKGYY